MTNFMVLGNYKREPGSKIVWWSFYHQGNNKRKVYHLRKKKWLYVCVYVSVCVRIPLVVQNEEREIDYQKRGNNAVLFYSRKLKEYLIVKNKLLLGLIRCIWCKKWASSLFRTLLPFNYSCNFYYNFMVVEICGL